MKQSMVVWGLLKRRAYASYNLSAKAGREGGVFCRAGRRGQRTAQADCDAARGAITMRIEIRGVCNPGLSRGGYYVRHGALRFASGGGEKGRRAGVKGTSRPALAWQGACVRARVWCAWARLGASTVVSRDCKQQHQQSRRQRQFRATGTAAAVRAGKKPGRQDGLDPILLRVEKLQMLRSQAVAADEQGSAGIPAIGTHRPRPRGTPSTAPGRAGQTCIGPHTGGGSSVDPAHLGPVIGRCRLTHNLGAVPGPLLCSLIYSTIVSQPRVRSETAPPQSRRQPYVHVSWQTHDGQLSTACRLRCGTGQAGCE